MSEAVLNTSVVVDLVGVADDVFENVVVVADSVVVDIGGCNVVVNDVVVFAEVVDVVIGVKVGIGLNAEPL